MANEIRATFVFNTGKAKKDVDALGNASDKASKKSKAHRKGVKDLGGSYARLSGSLRGGAAQFLGVATGVAAAALALNKMRQEVTESVKRNIEFEASMTRLETLVGLTRGTVEGMTDSVRELSKSSGRGTLELAEGLFQITSAGLRGKVALDTLRAASDAARVGLGDVATIADVATSAMNAYGQANITAEEAVGVLLKTVREGKASPEELASSLGRIIPLAATMGVEFSEVSGIVASMTRIGFSSAESVTALRGAMSAIIKPTEESKSALEEVGLSMSDVQGTLDEDGLLAALQRLRVAMSDEQFARFIGRTEALAGVLGVTGSRFEETASIVESTADTYGVLDAATERVAETAADKAARFKTGWETAIDSLTDKFIEFALSRNANEANRDIAAGGPKESERAIENVAPIGIADELDSIATAAAAFVPALGDVTTAAGLSTDALAALAEADKDAGEATRAAAAETSAALIVKEAADKKAAESALIHQNAVDDLADSLGTDGLQREVDLMVKSLIQLDEEGKTLSSGGLEAVRDMAERAADELGKVPPEIAKFIGPTTDLEKAVAAATMSSDELIAAGGEMSRLVWIDPELPKDIDTARIAEEAFNDSLEQAAHFAQAFGGSLGGMISQLIGVGGALKGLAGGGGFLKNIKGIFGSASEDAGGGFLGAISGIASLAGPIGAIAGPAIKGITSLVGNLFGGRNKDNVQKEVRLEMGAAISDGLAEAINDSGKNAMFFLSDIFAEGGFTADRLAEEVGDIFANLGGGGISKPEAIEALELAIPTLIEQLGNLGPEGEMQIDRIISAAQTMGVEFEGLGELISSTFAPQTLEQMKETLGLTGEEVRALAETLGVDLQTNLQRAAQEAGLTVQEFKALQEAAGAALGNDTAATMEELEALMAATGLSAAALAERLNVDVAGGAESLADEMATGTTEIEAATFWAGNLKNELLAAAQAAGSINIPGGGSGDVPAFANGGFVPETSPNGRLVRVAEPGTGGEFIAPRNGGGGAGTNVTINQTNNLPAGSDAEQAHRIVDLINRDIANLQKTIVTVSVGSA